MATDLSWIDRGGIRAPLGMGRLGLAPTVPVNPDTVAAARGGTVAAATPVAAATEGRSFGFQSGAARPTMNAPEHEALAAYQGAAFQEPTEFKGGAGAPPPVEVVRGLRTTYTNPAPDTGGGYAPTQALNTAEYATPVQAAQAYNRGMRMEYIAAHPQRPNLTYPEGTSPEEQATQLYGAPRASAEEIAQIRTRARTPEERLRDLAQKNVFETEVEKRKAEAQQKITEANVTRYDELLHQGEGTFDAGKGARVFVPKTEEQADDKQAGMIYARQFEGKGGGEAGYQLYQQRQAARRWIATQPSLADVNVNQYLDRAQADPKEWGILMNNAKTLPPPPAPDNRWFGARWLVPRRPLNYVAPTPEVPAMNFTP